MRSIRFQLAAVTMAALSCAAHGQVATITQSGTNDAASVDQTSGGSSYASIIQSAGSANSAAVLQAPNGVANANASTTVIQQGTTGDIANATQLGAANGSTLSITQTGGAGSSADVLQANVSATRARVTEGGNSSSVLVQQTLNTTSGYVAAELVGNGGKVSVLQGQPDTGGVTNTSARVLQYGDGNTGVTVQSGTTSSNAYTSQGSSQMVGAYYNGASTGYVTVDANVPFAAATNSSASTYQTGGTNQHAYILQYGSTHSAYVSQAGDSNLGGVLQSGSGNNATIIQTGLAGNASVAQYGVGQGSVITQSGVGNTATIKQH